MTAPDAAELVARYLPLARKVARRFAESYPWVASEFESAAVAELWRAAVGYSPDRGTFVAYARPCLRFKCLQVIRDERRTSPTSFAPQWSPTPKNDTDPLDAAPGRHPDPADVALRLDLPGLLATLPEDRADAVVRSVSHGETHESIAASRGQSRGRVGQVIAESLAALRVAAGTS